MAVVSENTLNHLVSYVRGRLRAGRVHAPLDKAARRFLERLASGDWQPPEDVPARPPTGPADRPDRPPAGGGTTHPEDTPVYRDLIDPLLAEAPVAPAGERLEPPGDTPSERIAWLREHLDDDPEVGRLSSLRDTLVYSVGDPAARLMLVGEAPGSEEEVQGEPFVGPAGQLLTKILQAMGLERGGVYISNIVKFRPAMPSQGTSNRAPTDDEMVPFRPYIHAEVDVVRPEVIVLLGGTAVRGLTGETTAVARLRDQVRLWRGIPLIVTYHPSYLLRKRPGLRERRLVWEDMLRVMERLALPISEKQRNFFLSR